LSWLTSSKKPPDFAVDIKGQTPARIFPKNLYCLDLQADLALPPRLGEDHSLLQQMIASHGGGKSTEDDLSLS
jgi:hypothetical protein